ncbi:hypothetical protein RJ641_000031 [Dillenia turbinata]|uniref:Uncharacterized protein n=1 Tax=Dillenia turbinata TaxID=194707 RepID=A0AAN8YSB7_9MAGN
MASNSSKDVPSASTPGASGEQKFQKASAMEHHSGQRRGNPESGFPTDNFDFSAMTGLLNDPSIKVMAEQIAKDPMLNQMAEQLQKNISRVRAEDGIPHFDSQQYLSTMQQDPAMSSMLENLTNPSQSDLLEERMARSKQIHR